MTNQTDVINELRKRIDPFIESTSRRYGLEPSLVHAVIANESAYNPVAISPKGAKGLMQLMPDTAKELGVKNPFNPKQNIEGGVKYLAQLVKQYGGDTKKALAAYNAGPGNVDKEFPETKKYVQNVTKSAGMELGNKPMNYTKEQIMQELEKRGHKSFPSTKESESLNKQTVYQELKRRGMDDTEIFKKLSKQPKSLTFWQSMIEEVPEFAGSIAGGLIFKSPVGSTIGAGVGGAVGRAGSEVYQQATGQEPPKTVGQIAEESLKAGGTQALFQAGGLAAGKVAGKILQPFKKSLMPEADTAIQTLEKYMPKESWKRPISRMLGMKKPALLPAEATENRVLDLLNNVAESSLIGGSGIAKHKIMRGQAVSDMIDDVVSQVGRRVDADQLGDLFVASINRNVDAVDLITKPIYNTVENMVGQNPMVSTANLKRFVQPMLNNIEQVGTVGATNAGDNVVLSISELPDNITFSAAKELRTRLRSIADEFLVTNKKAPAIGKANALTKLTDNAIDDALSANNPEALRLWREANALYKEGREKYSNEFIRRLVKEAEDKGNPETIANRVFKPGAISNIKRVKEAVDAPTYQKMKSWYVSDVLKKSVDSSGEIKGTMFFNRLYGKTGMGEQTLRSIFSPEEYRSIKDMATTLKILDQKQGEGIGRMFIQLSQASAAVGAMTGTMKPVSYTILGGPVVLARLFTNPVAVKWLTYGAKLPPNHPQLATAVAKIAKMAHDIYQDMHKEKAFESAKETITKRRAEEEEIK